MQQAGKPVVVYFMHQMEQPANFARGKTLTCEPIEVMAGQIRDESALVFAERHGERHEAFEVVRIHKRINVREGLAPVDIGTGPIGALRMIRLCDVTI